MVKINFYISAKNYPAAMLSRAVNYETKDMLAFVSFETTDQLTLRETFSFYLEELLSNIPCETKVLYI